MAVWYQVGRRGGFSEQVRSSGFVFATGMLKDEGAPVCGCVFTPRVRIWRDL